MRSSSPTSGSGADLGAVVDRHLQLRDPRGSVRRRVHGAEQAGSYTISAPDHRLETIDVADRPERHRSLRSRPGRSWSVRSGAVAISGRGHPDHRDPRAAEPLAPAASRPPARSGAHCRATAVRLTPAGQGTPGQARQGLGPQVRASGYGPPPSGPPGPAPPGRRLREPPTARRRRSHHPAPAPPAGRGRHRSAAAPASAPPGPTVVPPRHPRADRAGRRGAAGSADRPSATRRRRRGSAPAGRGRARRGAATPARPPAGPGRHRRRGAWVVRRRPVVAGRPTPPRPGPPG